MGIRNDAVRSGAQIPGRYIYELVNYRQNFQQFDFGSDGEGDYSDGSGDWSPLPAPVSTLTYLLHTQ